MASPALRVHRGGFGVFSGPEARVQLLQGIVVAVVGGLTPELHAQGYHAEVQLLVHLGGEITAGIGYNLKTGHSFTLHLFLVTPGAAGRGFAPIVYYLSLIHI